MHIKDITLKILIIGIEDVSSLHEILWDFSDENLMTETKLQIVKVAEKLLQLGLIKLYWCKESYGKLTEIPLNNEALALIIQEKYWAPPEQNSLWLRFETTKAGEAFYKKIYQDGEASFLLL